MGSRCHFADGKAEGSRTWTVGPGPTVTLRWEVASRAAWGPCLQLRWPRFHLRGSEKWDSGSRGGPGDFPPGVKGAGVPAWKKLPVAGSPGEVNQEGEKQEGGKKKILTKKCGTITRKGRWLEEGWPGASLEAPLGSVCLREPFLQSRQISVPSMSRP